MIAKEKLLTTSSNVRMAAGDEAEKDMAYRLKRRFDIEPDVHVINDLWIVHGEASFQIDHLLVTRWGLFIVESKSVQGTVSIKVWDDKREHWSRSYQGKFTGMESPLLQAEEQARLLKAFLYDNSEQLRGKLFGLLQKGFRYCPVLTMAAISQDGIVEVESGPLPDRVFKADEIAPKISEHLAELRKISRPYSLSPDVGWDMSSEEAARVAAFLVASHTPRTTKLVQTPITNETPVTAPGSRTSMVPRVGAACPICGTRKLVRGSVKRSDETETDYLACEGYPGDCHTLFALVAQPEKLAISDATTRAPMKQAAGPIAKGKPTCFECSATISEGVAGYCLGQKQLFKGKTYCMKCQDKFR